MKLPTAAGPRSASSLMTIVPFGVVIVAIAVEPAAACGGGAFGQVEAPVDGTPAEDAEEGGAGLEADVVAEVAFELHPAATRPTAREIAESAATIGRLAIMRRPLGRRDSRSRRRAVPRRG